MQLSHREKWLLTVPVFLGGAILFYNYVHAPLMARKQAASVKFETVKVDLLRGQSKLKQQGDLTARQSAVANREQVVDAWVPGKNSAAMLIWYLSQAEVHSGARVTDIKLSDRKEANPSAPQSQPPGTSPNQPAPTPAPTTQSPADAAASAPASAQQSTPSVNPNSKTNEINPGANITVIGIDLKVEAKFVEHMLFSQEIEQLPLFLSVDALDMAVSKKSSTDKVNELLMKGDRAGAERMLTASPTVTTIYHINLYFKGPRPGPAVSNTMQFQEDTGKLDPFVNFQQTLQDYVQQHSADKTSPGSGEKQPDTQENQAQQLG